MTDGYHVASAAEVGVLVREKRLAASMTQQQLADLVGSTRQWVIRLEQGHQGTMMGTALMALSALGLEMVAQFETSPRAPQ